jgi:hypothetical protein
MQEINASEILVQIRNRKFVAGIVMINDVVRETAPILRFLKGWSRQRVWEYCARHHWQIEIVSEARQADMFEVSEALRTDPDAAP